MQTLFDANGHKNVMFDDLSSGHMVQANQHLIVANGEALLLDPGGHKIYTQLFAKTAALVPISGLKHILFSHQDPDIVAAANGWLMVTDAKAYLSALWLRFIPHFGIDDLMVKRITPIPDGGMVVIVGGTPITLLPAHFLHSPGNFQAYDPVSKILYTGDLGASLGQPYVEVPDFDGHIPYMDGFHRRYMPSSRALKLWAAMVRTLEIDTIAPQHGAIIKGKPMVARFIDWIDNLVCGVDTLEGVYTVPKA